MAKAGASKEDDDSFYILYCCIRCDEKFTTAKLLKSHKEKCLGTASTGWIKQEPNDDGESSPSQQEDHVEIPVDVKAEDSPPFQDHVAPAPPSKTFHPPPLKIKLNQIKNEPKDQPPSLPKHCAPTTVIPEQTRPLLVMTPGRVVSPQFSSQQQHAIPQPPLVSQSSELKPQYYNAAQKLPASEILRQRFQNTQSHQASGSGPPPPVTMKDHYRKKSLLTTSTVRSIRPKDSIVQDAVEHVLPKIENVYYTSKSSEDPVGQATLADSVVWRESGSHEERVLNLGNGHKTSVNMSSKSKCSKKPKSSHVEEAKKIVNTNIHPSHQIILTTKAAQSHNQGGDVASDLLRQAALPVQKSQVIPASHTHVVIQTHQGIFQVPSSFLQNPQNILPGSLPVLQTSQPVLQNTQTLLQPNMLQQNFLQAQVVQQNLQTPLMLNHPPVSQIMPVVNPQHLTIKPSVAGAVSASKAEGTITTTASKKPDSAAVSVVISETVTSSMSNPVMSTSAPVVALSHIVGGIPPVPAAQTMQFTVPNPNGSGFLVLAGDVKQAPSTSEPKANSSEVPGKKPLLTPPVGNLPVVSLANQQHGLVQSPSSNVVLLPPVMAQGHILSGIRLQSSNLNLTAGHSKKFVGESTPSSSSVSENPSTNVSSSADAATKPLDIIQVSQSQLQGLPVMKFKQPEVGTAISPQSSIHDNKSSGQGKLQSCLPDKTVLDVAELLLFGDKTHDFKKWGPAVLNDGRIFVPVAYTGPYKLKSAESSSSSLPGKTKSTKKDPVEKGDHGKNTEKKHMEHKGVGESTLAQTVTLPGDVVWIFLDRDGPKIVWKMDTVPPQAMVLPLDFDLPAEALRQVAEMLHKANIEFPKGLLNLPPVSKKVLVPKPGLQPPMPLFRRVEYKMMQIMNRKSKLLLPKGDAPATSAASTPAISPTPATTPTHSTSRTTPTLSPSAFTPSFTTPVSVPPPPLQVRPSNSGTKHSFPGTVLKKGNLAAGPNVAQLPMLVSALQSQPVTPLKSVENPTTPFAATSLSSMSPALFGSTPTVIQASKLKVEDISQENVSQPAIATAAAAAAAAVFDMSELQQREWGKKRQKNVPQLTVNADPKTVKRALDAFVRVERISFTQEQEQQAQSYRKARKTHCLASYGNSLMRNCRSKSKNVKDESGTFILQNEIKSENQVLRLDSEKETSKEMEAEENSLQKKGNQSKVKILPNREKDHKGRKRLVDKEWVAVSRWKRQRTNEFEYEYHTNRDESVSGSEHKMRKSSRLGCLEEDVRRSVRICCKPKPDYSALNSQDYLDAEIDEKCDSVEGTLGTPEVSGGPKFQEKASAEKGKSVVPSASKVRSLGKHSGFDVYIESAEGGDGEIDDEDEGGLVIDESIGDQPAEGQDSSDSLELFLKKHKRDIQQVVMKEAKGKETSDNILYLCTICGSFQSRSRDELVSHLKQHYNGELSCKTCRFQAASKQELLEHDALEHTGKPLYHCPSCKTSFFSQAIYQNHLKRHNASVFCKVCSRAFLSEGGLREHMERDHIKEFPCLMCDQRFISEDKLRSHYTHCKDGFQCCLCVVKLALLDELGEHMEAAHHFKDNLYICNVDRCGATFITESALKHHATNVVHL